jgi:hypothetical protein
MKTLLKKLFKTNSNLTLKGLKDKSPKKETHVCDNPKCENFKITGTMVNTLLIGLLIH